SITHSSAPATQVTTTGQGDVALTATNSSIVVALGGAGSVGGAGGSTGGVAVSLGFALATNFVANTTQALIDGSSVSSGGAVALNAHTTSHFLAVAAGISGDVAGGSTGGVTFAGAGALANNIVLDNTIAQIRDGSNVTTIAGPVQLTAIDEPAVPDP